MKKSELIDIYYFLFDVVDDIDMFTDLIKEKTDTKLTKAKIKSNLEYLNLNKLDSELNIIYDMKMEDLKKFKRVYMLKNEMLQSSMEDLF